MTLIALLHKGSFPMVITDNLISADAEGKNVTPKFKETYQTPDTPLDTKEQLTSKKSAENFYSLGMANKIWKTFAPANTNMPFFLMYAGSVERANKLFEDIKTLSPSDDIEYMLSFHKNNKEISAIVICKNANNKIEYFSIGDIGRFITLKNKEGILKNISFSAIAIIGGSGFKPFSKLLIQYYENHLQSKQLKYFTKTDCDDDWTILHPNINIAYINDINFFEQCYLMSLNLLALCTAESLRKSGRSELVRNACGGLYNLRHFVELYPDYIQQDTKLSDTGLCQIFTEKINNIHCIKKFILTNYTDDNKTISYVLNKQIDITKLNLDIKKLNKKISLETINKSEFEVFEIHDKRSDNEPSRKISNLDTVFLNANQLIIYEYIDGNFDNVNFMPYANKGGLHCHDKLVKININNNSLDILLDLADN